MHAKDKFVAFIDILGFTNLVEQAEGGDFSRALELAAALGDRGDSDMFKAVGPTTCPESTYVAKNWISRSLKSPTVSWFPSRSRRQA